MKGIVHLLCLLKTYWISSGAPEIISYFWFICTKSKNWSLPRKESVFISLRQWWCIWSMTWSTVHFVVTLQFEPDSMSLQHTCFSSDSTGFGFALANLHREPKSDFWCLSQKWESVIQNPIHIYNYLKIQPWSLSLLNSALCEGVSEYSANIRDRWCTFYECRYHLSKMCQYSYSGWKRSFLFFLNLLLWSKHLKNKLEAQFWGCSV